MPHLRDTEMKPELEAISLGSTKDILQTVIYQDSIRHAHEDQHPSSKCFVGEDFTDDLFMNAPQSRRGAIVELPPTVDPKKYIRNNFNQNKSDSQSSIPNASKSPTYETSLTLLDIKKKHRGCSSDSNAHWKYSTDIPSPASETSLKKSLICPSKNSSGTDNIFNEVRTTHFPSFPTKP